MPFRQKVFRIEALCPIAPADATTASSSESSGNGLQQLRQETDSILQAIDRTRQEIAALQVQGVGYADTQRVRQQLNAVVGDAERATLQILSAAEDIDEAANTLTAVLRHEQDQMLAQDIRDQVIRIFEACNFHDLTGQRIGKVLETLKTVDDSIARMTEIWSGATVLAEPARAAETARQSDAPPANGPKLDGDRGHASQADIDLLFRRA